MSKQTSFRLRFIKCSLILLFLSFFGLVHWQRFFSGSSSTKVYAQSNKVEQTPGERFDEIVREDFFAGMLGDEKRLERGMTYCEEVLAKNPKHAEALVWHGGGLLTRATRAYRKGNDKVGDSLWEKGIKEMNEAVRLEPNRIDIMIGRSATLIGLAQAGLDSSDLESKKLLESALIDYEKVYQQQKPTFGKLGEHSRGELLFGLASGWSILGEQEKAQEYLKLILTEVKGTSYETQAQKWLNQKPSVIQHDCRGCHIN